MRNQEFLKTLKTAKKAVPSIANQQTPINSLFNSLTSEKHTTISSFISSITSHKLHSFLCDPTVNTFDCLRIFNLVLHHHNDISFNPDIHAHFTLLCRLIKSRMFSDAEILLRKFILGPHYRYPYDDFISWIENYCKESKIITKLLNMLLKMYSDHGMFDMVVTVFQYMVVNDIVRDEKTCTVHLYTLVKSGNVDLAIEFFGRMVDSRMEVSVFSLTTVVSGLCEVGELKMGRELVEEMSRKGVKPNVITFNTLMDGCMRRWEFAELDMVLCLMKKEGIEFNDTSFKLLIEGYCGSSKVDEAKMLLLEMQDKGFEGGSYLYDMIIRGYCRLGNMRSGLQLLRIMQEKELTPCDDIYGSLICGLCHDGDMGQVNELVNEVLNEGGMLDDVVVDSLEDAYQKAGMIDELEELKCIVMKYHADREPYEDSDASKTLC